MFANDLIAAFRTFRRRGGHVTVSILGLALGLACAVAVALYVHDELSYDRFHEHADRIARVELQIQQGDHVFTLPPFGSAGEVLEADPDVESLVQVARAQRLVVHRDGFRAYEEGLVFAPSEVLDVFSFPLERGDPGTALERPHTVVLTREAAATYFGDEDPLGQSLRLGDTGVFEVTGVFRPLPSNSTLRFTMLASAESLPEGPGLARTAYALLRPTSSPAVVAERLLPRIQERLPQMPITSVSVDPLTALHLHALSPTRSRDLAGNVRYLYLFGGVGLIILLLATVNFVNLATAHALSRAREVGVRKTLGARRSQLIRQYLTEAGLQSATALAVAVALVSASLPALNALVGKSMALSAVPVEVSLGGGLALWATTTFLAGLYPALVLSGYRPTLVLKGGPAREGRSGRLRQSLVVFQFAATIALLISLFTIMRQTDYLRGQHLALAADQVLLLEPREQVLTEYDAFKNALGSLPGVSHVSVGYFPGGIGMATRLGGEEEQRPVNTLMVDGDFLDVLGVRLVVGRPLDATRPADVSSAVLINEAAARAFGWADDPLGRQIHRMDEQRQMVASEVIGVVEDFPYAALHRGIAPQIITLTTDPMAGARQGIAAPSVIVRLDTGALAETMASVAGVWEAFAPDHPFEYAFLDERFEVFYRGEARLQRLFTVFTALALALACLGLVGLAAFTAERRTKEIGVRKVLGASAASIVALLSREFLVLVAVAFVIASPLAYWMMGRWLEGFAYRITLGPALFVAAGTLAALVALGAVSYHALRAASADPVEALRSE